MAKECCNANSGATLVKTDFYRIERVPSLTYKRVIELHNRYLEARKDIDAQKGIISPIKAVVFRPNRATYCDMRFINNLIETVMNIQFRMPVDEYDDPRPSVDVEDVAFMNRATAVGYCVALPDPTCPEFPFRVGVSYCRPEDHKYFNEEFGILKAYEYAQEFNSCNESWTIPGPMKRMTSHDRRCSVFYFWPNSFEKQVADFHNRVSKYFKPIKPKDNVEENN